MAKVFVSYSRKDIEFAKRLTAELQKCDLDFWIDWEGIPPTVDWWKEIEKGIEEADVFLFLISPDSAKSKVCGQEIDTAVKNGKRIISLVVRDIEGEEAPKQLSHLNWIFFRPSDDFDTAFQKLKTAIHTDYEWVQQHRWLQIRALDWERDNKDKGSLLRGKDLQDAEFQLAINSSKEPYPTDLQRVYVFESRKDKDQQRGVMAVISIVTVITLVALASYGFYQANAAQQLANTSLARQLAAQAQSLYMLGGPENDTAILLAAMSTELYPNWEAAQILQNPKLLSPVSLITLTSSDSRDVHSLDGNFRASINPDGDIRVLEEESGKEVAYLPMHEIPLPSVFSPNGRYEALGDCDESGDYCLGDYAVVREVSSGNEIFRIVFGNRVKSIAFSPDSRFFISAGCELTLVLSFCGTSTVRVWEIDAKNEIAILTFDGNVSSAVFSKNGRYILSSGCATECFIRIDTLEKNNERLKPPEFKDMVADPVSPNSKFRFKGEGLDAIIMESTNGKEIKRISNKDLVNFAVFSPDSKYLAWATNTTTVVWNMKNQREMFSISFDDSIRSLSFSPDGKYIAALGCDVQHCAHDAMIRIWNVETGTEINRISCPWGAMSFTDDGKHVFLSCTGKPDNYIMYKPEDLIEHVCKRLSRNLTLDEWKKYIGNARPYPSSHDNAICPELPLSFEATPNSPRVQ